MNPSYYVSSYARHLRELKTQFGDERAMEELVGGADHWVGVLEYGALLNLGLQPHHTIVDVGCGTGRLSGRLAKSEFPGRYTGTDLLPEIIDYARRRTGNPDWTFAVSTEPPLPVAAESADWVTFFSVFTHLADEDIFLYLAEARRILKPAGKVVFSFLEFSNPDHWALFEKGVKRRAAPGAPLNRFTDRSILCGFAAKLGFTADRFFDGSDPWIHLEPPLVEYRLSAPFWQSVGVFSPLSVNLADVSG